MHYLMFYEPFFVKSLLMIYPLIVPNNEENYPSKGKQNDNYGAEKSADKHILF